jgi:hypothetical protein
MLVMPVLASAQEEAQNTIIVSDHTTAVWDAKVDFWANWEAQYRSDETIAHTWGAKAAFWGEQAFQVRVTETIAQTWAAKVAFWQG